MSRDNEIEHLKLLAFARLCRVQFGRESEKLDRELEQLEPRLDELEATQAEKAVASQTSAAAAPMRECGGKTRAASAARASAARSAEVSTEAERLSGLRRNTKTTGRRHLGDTGVRAGAIQSDPAGSAEAGVRVLRAHRASGSAEPSDRAGIAGPGLLAHVLVSKSCDRLPLYRQSEIYAREGVELERSTMADWVGGASVLLAPLVEALRRHVMSATKLARR